tara:strand:- start:272 stop:652 length:381 start_codon:yes stop_codon:yes gene_type:complete
MMRHRKIRKFRHRSNNRGFFSRDNGVEKTRVGSRPFSNGRPRNNFKLHHNPEKLVEKYSALAKEALSSGDKILSENYFQHADHFMRLVDSKNSNQNQTNNTVKETKEETAVNNNEIVKNDQTTKEN